MMTSDTADDRDGDEEDEGNAADEDVDENRADENSERATLKEVEHTHPHTDETFDRTGVHGRGKRSDSDEEDAGEH